MNDAYVRKIVSAALSEDIGRGDVTTNALVPAKRKAAAFIVFRSPGVVCGLGVAGQAFKCLDPKIRFKPLVRDGIFLSGPARVACIEGSARALLTAERAALNFLGRLSGIATQTKVFVDKIKPYKSIIMDTRKTTPLLRVFERYAVSCGGGVNHRFDLGKMAMIKDNHQAFFAGSMAIKAMVAAARKKSKTVEVEVDDLAQLREALVSSADIILLDNMTVFQTQRAVRMRDEINRKILLEASGGITLANVRGYAAAGVDRISVGALTHSPKGIDVSLEFIP